MHSGFSAQLNEKRWGRGSNAARRRLAKGRQAPTLRLCSLISSMRLRAIAARLQAEHIPPLRLLPFGRTRAQQVAQPSPRTGKGDRVSGGRGPWTDGQGLYSIGSPHKRCSPACGGAKRGMPVASPGVARRAERGPWTRTCAYFDLHGNDKLLRAVTPSVSCADSFPQGDAISTSP